MKKLFEYCFEKWWIPIVFWILTVAFFIMSNGIFGNIGFIFLGLGLSGLFISSIYQLLRKRWLKACLTGFPLGMTIFVFIFYVLLMMFIGIVDGDKFADNLTIPNDIPIEIPVDFGFDYHRPDSVSNRQVTEMDFQLYNSFQPGLFEYDLWIGQIESGTIYLKAFEITQEYALSTDRLPKRSSIRIYNPTDSIKKFGTTSHFTIYEGDWGKPYAARFEVWFKPDSGGEERKLLTKNYKIEGWMR